MLSVLESSLVNTYKKSFPRPTFLYSINITAKRCLFNIVLSNILFDFPVMVFAFYNKKLPSPKKGTRVTRVITL